MDKHEANVTFLRALGLADEKRIVSITINLTSGEMPALTVTRHALDSNGRPFVVGGDIAVLSEVRQLVPAPDARIVASAPYAAGFGEAVMAHVSAMIAERDIKIAVLHRALDAATTHSEDLERALRGAIGAIKDDDGNAGLLTVAALPDAGHAIGAMR